MIINYYHQSLIKMATIYSNRGLIITKVSIAIILILILRSIYNLVSHRNEGNIDSKFEKSPMTSLDIDTFLKNKLFFMKNRNEKNINCAKILKENALEFNRALTFNIESLYKYTPKDYIRMTRNCSAFIENRGYITHYLTEEERKFPIAYSILMYKNVEQTERLLRAIYRPQNVYCLHVDSKSDEATYTAMLRLAQCFNNIVMTKERISVVWGEMSVLEPELLCMKTLLRRNKRWKYFINLTGQEFPLKTNYELVSILKAYNGANDVDGSVVENLNRCMPNYILSPPPHGILISKGAVHIAVSRGYVDYVINDKRAHDILQWMNRSCFIPDESFFTTMNINPHLGVPGSYLGHPETTEIKDVRKPYLARFKNRQHSRLHLWECKGEWVRGMCVLSFLDLPFLSKRKEMFANKFHLYEQPLTFGCLEEMIYNRTRDQYLGKMTFDASWYSSLGFVKNQFRR